MAQPAGANGAVNVVIIGATGAGKSSLANLLVFNKDAPEHGFAVGYGSKSQTTAVESNARGNLQVLPCERRTPMFTKKCCILLA